MTNASSVSDARRTRGISAKRWNRRPQFAFQTRKGKIDVASFERRHRLHAVDLLDRHGQLRKLRFQMLDERRKRVDHRRRDSADRQYAAISLRRFLHRELQALELLGEFPDGRQDRRADLRQLGAVPSALEQLDLQRLFEHLNLFGQRRLRHTKPLRGATEKFLFSDGEKQPQMADKSKVDHGFDSFGV
jgi:hypothetical protein